MIKYFTIEDLLKHYLQKKFHTLIGNGTYFFVSEYWDNFFCFGAGGFIDIGTSFVCLLFFVFTN